MSKYIIHTDGGSRGNPGHSGIGVVIEKKLPNSELELIEEYDEYIGIATNNQAEYQAIFWALKRASELRLKDVDCYLDSQLVVRQLNGEYKIKNEGLKVIYKQILEILPDFDSISFQDVRREFNKRADELANVAMDKVLDL